MTATLKAISEAIGAPTFRQYDNNAAQWLEWKRQAAVLAPKDLERHATVSTSNRHQCRNCFCCAALKVYLEMQELEKQAEL